MPYSSLQRLSIWRTWLPKLSFVVALNAADGARTNARQHNLKIVYDNRYPPKTADFAPIVRAIAATKPDVVVD